MIGKIYRVRGKQIILSHDLPELYGVETRVLNQQVKRNLGKFPERYMFQLTRLEFERLRSQNVILKRGQNIKYLPHAFTEHGILMISSVLNNERANIVNQLIIDTFIKLRELIFLYKNEIQQLEKIQDKLEVHDKKIIVIFEYLMQIEIPNIRNQSKRTGCRLVLKSKNSLSFAICCMRLPIYSS
jgi:hypothetical protein